MTLYPRREVVPVLLRLAKREDTSLLMQRAFVCFVCQAMRPSGRVACFLPKCHIPPANYGLWRANYGL